MPTLVKFNRKFTQAQLTAAVGTSSINSTAVQDGTWYIAKTGATALYVGSIESGSTATLKLVAEINANVLTGKEITTLINNYIANPSPDTTATLITKVDSAVKDKDGNAIDSTYLKKSGGTMTGDIEFGANSATWGSGSAEITYVGDQDDELQITAPVISLTSTGSNKSLSIGVGDDLTYDGHKVLDTGAQTLTSTEKTQVLTNIGAEPAGTASGLITGLDGTITKTAGSASASTAASAYQKVPVVSGFVLRERDGKLIETTAGTTPSTVSTVDVDAAGSAQKALNDAKSYADSLISDLGSVMTFKGTKATESALKTDVTTPHKGDVYIVTADSSEWVYSGDTVDGTHAYDSTKWEKFGTTDVSGALYKGANTFTNGTLVIADGTDGKMKAISDADMATRLADETALTGKYKVLQTAVSDSGTGYVSAVTQNTQGVITVTKTALPSGSGSVGTASSATDAWKTVVHDVSLSGHTLSGNTKSIPAAAAGTSASNGTDGYMTKAQAYKLAGIADGAEVNQNAFSNVKVGSTTIAAGAKTDTIELVQSTNITLTPDGTNKKVTISSPNVGGSVGSTSSAADAWKTLVHDVAGSNHSIAGNTKTIPAATSSNDGYMTSTQVGTLTAVAAALAWEE